MNKLLTKRYITAKLVIISLMLSSCYVRFPDNVPAPVVSPTELPSPAAEPEPQLVDSEGPLEFRRVLSGENSNVKQFEVRTIENDADFQTLWDDHTGSDTNPIFLPKVDFELKKVLAIFLGDRPTTGYNVEIEKILETEDKIYVHFREIKPKSGDIVKAEITQPFLMIEVKNSAKQFVFENPTLIRTNVINLEFNSIDSGSESGIKEFSNLVIKTEDEFNRIYRTHLANRKTVGSATFPDVDFDNYMVAAIFLGTRPGQGYSLEVQNVQRTDTQIIVTAREVPPDVRDGSSSSPYNMVEIPRSELPVKFDINLIVPSDEPVVIENNLTSDLEIRPLFIGEKSEIISSNFLIIQNRSDFVQWWNRHSHNSNEPAPDIDFGNNTMIAAFLGNRDNNITVNISKVVETANEVRIFVDISESRVISASNKIQPYSIVLVPKFFKQGTFIVNNITK